MIELPLVRNLIVAGLVAALGLSDLSAAGSAEPARPSEPSEPTVPPETAPALEEDAKMKTLGGVQFWGDVHFFHQWRIQRNVLTGHYRLLDEKNNRHASGTFKLCRSKLDHIRKTQKLPAMSGKAVILLHGVVRTWRSMNAMREPFEKAGYTVLRFGYPSTRTTIQQVAEHLHRAIESLEGIDEINFVVHSMGGLVVRTYLAEHRDERMGRMVMLGVPNLGAHLADRLKDVALFRAIFGPAGQQLVADPAGFIARLPTPDFEFAVIAGARGTDRGYNPLIPGDDDGIVSVDSTRLPGAADFATVQGLHTFLMNSDKSIEYSVRFIQTGHLRADGLSYPIPEPDPQPNTRS